MARSDPVTPFIRDALMAGHSRAEIRKALAQAGWSTREIDQGLGGFADSEFLPPVPRPQRQTTARETFVYAILYTALAVTASHLVGLVHSVLDLQMPDPADPPYMLGYAAERARWAIAVLLVSTPIFGWMTLYVDGKIKGDPSLRRSAVRKWLTYVTLFLSGLIFLGDATYALYSFLQGELRLRFLLKALTVGLVSAAVFLVYLRDVEDVRSE